MCARAKAPEAARILARRFRGRVAYRRRRDAKLSSEWIGCTFVFMDIKYLLSWHDPDRQMVQLKTLFGHSLRWTTDEFWRLYRSGKLVKE